MNDHFSEWMKGVCEGNVTIGTLYMQYKVRKGNILKVLSRRPHRLVVKIHSIMVAIHHAKY